MTWFKQKWVGAIGTGEMSRRLRVVLAYVGLEASSQMTRSSFSKRCPNSHLCLARHPRSLSRGLWVAAKGTCGEAGETTLKCLSRTLVFYTWGIRWRKRAHQSLLWDCEHKGAVKPSLCIHRDRDKACCPRCLNKSIVIFPCHCVIDSFLYWINLEIVTNFS